jgi:Protein of unknown function (DUF1161)
MRTIVVVAALWSGGAVVNAQGVKPCTELQAEIAAKIDAKGVKGYTLEIVAPDAVGDRKVVGSCEGGAKRIVYVRGT